MKRPLSLLCLAFAAVLTLCMQIMPMPVPDYGNLDGRQVRVEGKVYWKEYKEREGSGKIPVIYLKSVHILDGSDDESRNSEYLKRNSSKQIPNNEIKNIFCYMEKEGYREPDLGSTVCLEGEARSFAQAGNPGEFDMQGYYRMMKISFRLDNAHIRAYGEKKWHVREGLCRLQRYFTDTLEAVFPPKEASIMKAVLLGEKSGLDAETKELYRQSSIIHILSISGLHISMIGMGLYYGLRKIGMGLRPAAAVSIAVILGYGIMTGMSLSSVRAVIMFTFHLLADMTGRTYDMTTALTLAAALLLAKQPRYIEHSGFLFSFGAVASLGAFCPFVEELFGISRQEKISWEKYRKRGIEEEKSKVLTAAFRKMKQAAAGGIAVTLGTLPVHLWFYYQFPVYSILLNLAVIPLMTAVMGAGLFCMVSGNFFPAAAKTAAWIPRVILWFFEKCCLLGEQIPYGTWVSGRPEGWQILAYLLLLILLVAYGRKQGEKLTVFWKCQWIFATFCLLLMNTGNGFQVTMLDVGQGDCIYIRSGQGKSYLIDGGSSTKSKVMEYQILPYLKYMGVRHLEAVFVTHPDSDHCNGILSLLEEYPSQGLTAGTLILPDIGKQSADEQYKDLERHAWEKGIEVQYMSRGQQIADGDMRFVCMHPYRGYDTGEKNEYSLALRLSYRGFLGLFTGDVEGMGEAAAWEYMKSRGDVERLTVLKVAHHGSGYSTGREMLEMLRPRLSLISCGKDNRYGHPHKDLTERLESVGSRIYATPECGAVTLSMDGKKIRINSFRQRGGG